MLEMQHASQGDVNSSCHAFQDQLLLPGGVQHRRRWMSTPWTLRSPETPKLRVFDAFLFAGEVELLQTRMHVLRNVVDFFVIVEADVSHSGSHNRSLIFPTLRERLKPFMSRIHYRGIRAREVPQMRSCTDTKRRTTAAGAMRCENYMRGSLLREVLAAGARPTDILVSGDVDEIPRPEYVRPFRDCSIFGPRSNLRSHPTVVILLAKMYMFNIGCHSGQNRWSYGPKVGAVFQFDMLRDEPWRSSSGMNFRRWGNTAESGARWAASAWHLTNFMTPEALSRKLAGFHHFRDFSAADLAPSRLARLMAQCKSPYPDKYRRMRPQRPTLGSPSEDALAYIQATFPSLGAGSPSEAESSLRGGARRR